MLKMLIFVWIDYIFLLKIGIYENSNETVLMQNM